MLSKLEFHDLEAISRSLTALITNNSKNLKKTFSKFFKSLILSKVKFNDLEAISR